MLIIVVSDLRDNEFYNLNITHCVDDDCTDERVASGQAAMPVVSDFTSSFSNFDPSVKTFSSFLQNIKPSKCYETNSIPRNSDDNSCLLHLNIRSLQKNYDDMCEFLSNFNVKPHIISSSETKIKGKPLTNLSLPGYSFLHDNSQTNAGGVGVYIHESLRYDELDCTINFAGCEDIWIKFTCPITNNIFIIGTIYCHPITNVQNFLDCLNLILMKLNDTNKHFFILGDININLSLRQISSSESDYINMLLSYGIASVIDKPTRTTPSSATILHHIPTKIDLQLYLE